VITPLKRGWVEKWFLLRKHFMAIRVVHSRPTRAREEAHAVSSECAENPRQWIGRRRKKRGTEDECRSSTVDIKVVPLDGRADEGGESDFFQLACAVGAAG
jgi:hypothetical protein